MRRRDILFLAHVAYPDEVRVRREISALCSQRYTVDLVCLANPGQPFHERAGSLRIWRVPLPKTRHSVRTYLWEYSSFWVAAFILAATLSLVHRHRAVQVYNQPDFLVFAALVPKLLGSRIIFDYRDAMPEGIMDKYRKPAGHPAVVLARIIERASMKFADRLLTVHEPFRELLISRGFNPANIGVYLNLPDPAVFRPELRYQATSPKREPGRIRLFHHGTLNEIYNVGLVIDALALLRDDPSVDASLVVYGTGPDLPWLQSLVAKHQLTNVHFAGRVPLEEIPLRIVAEADAGVVPTRSGPIGEYSLSNKLLEYVCLGKPVIASRLPTFTYFFGPDSLLYHAPASAEELASAIRRLAHEPGLSRQLAEAALRDFERLSWDRNYLRFCMFIAETVAEAH